MNHSDQSLLLAAARSGDERAFRQLVEPYRHALEVHCYRMLGSAHDAEDLVQETLLRVWRALDRFEPRAKFQTWVYRIATNACLDELERRPRRPEPVDPFPSGRLDEAASPTYDPAARYAIREGMELALLRAIQNLPGRQRAILIFRDVLGWTAPEVAEVLQSTVAAVNSALQRARATVAQLLPVDMLRASKEAERRLLGRYIQAFETDDVDGLVALLREDAMLTMPPQPSVIGARAIAGFFSDTTGGDLSRIRLRPTWANGRPAAAIYRQTDDRGLIALGLALLEIEDEHIVAINAFIDPRVLAPFGFADDPAQGPFPSAT